jgi:methylated-DNA-[protein]-cysteine S-methyltransferase
MINHSLASPQADPTPPPTTPPRTARTVTATPAVPSNGHCVHRIAGVTRYALIDSPIGELLLTVDPAGRLTRLLFPKRNPIRPADWVRDERALAEPSRQLGAYFTGELREFELELAPSGTPFQLQVWDALRAIPYGQTTSYGEIARTIGQPAAARAVGGANNRNPISVIVPCHRVIGAGGALTGYGGGLDCKRRLLALEAGTPALA